MFRLTIGLLCSAALLGAQDDLDQQLRSIIGAYAIAAENAADPVNSEQALYAGAIPAMLRKLDPHSVFFDPEQFEQLKRMESLHLQGFRQRGVDSAGARDRAADTCRHALAEGGPLAGR